MFKAFYETLQVPIFVIDTNNKIVFANSSVEELLGHSAKTLMSVRLVKFVHKDFQVSVQAACDVVFDEGVGAEQKLSNLTFVKKSGRRVKVDLCIKHFRFNKEPCAVITLHDLSELVKYQDLKIHYQISLLIVFYLYQ